MLSAVALPVHAPAQTDAGVVEVEARGEGVSEEAARHEALRRALEQGAGVEIAARSEVRDFALIRDTIFARADGIIRDYRVLEQGPLAGGGFYCKVRAMVRKDAVASTWGEVQNVLEQLGRPGIAVLVHEVIDGRVQDGSILESQMEKRLLDAGFKVYARSQLQAIREKESQDAAAEGNVEKLRALAKDFGAQIFITGTAQANAAGVKELAGEPTAMYNGDAAVKMYYTDTGQLLASESLANWRGGARGYREISPQAGKKALENAGVELVERCYQSVMKRWSTHLSAGHDITLEIEGVGVGQAIRMKKMLRELDPDRITAVDGPSTTKNLVTFRIQAKMTAETLAEYLVDKPWSDLIELIDLKPYRIQARSVNP